MADPTTKSMSARAVTALTLAAWLAATTPATAAPPGDLRDLVDVRASSGENALEQRGYHLHHASQTEDGAYTYWWNSQAKRCVRVITRDGRYADLDTVDGGDCGHKGGGSGAGTAAAVVGAAALLGVLALSHKSHHYENGPRPGDSRQTAEFERGYRDGLYNQAYHNYNRDDFYARGYEQGTRQRDHETSYRPSYGGGGYGGFVNVNDLYGAQRGYAESELSRRGFAMIDSNRTDGAGRYTTWWRATSRQCLIVNTRDQQVHSIETARPRTCR
jgi:hypothetical protein